MYIPNFEMYISNFAIKFDAKIRNNADIRKRFWKINAISPINKGISRKIEESP